MEVHGWPTAVAIRDGKLIGAVSTREIDGRIVCGPLRVAIPNPARVILRLMGTYEIYLRSIGVTKYLFYADTEDAPWVRQLRKASSAWRKIDLIESSGGKDWYSANLAGKNNGAG